MFLLRQFQVENSSKEPYTTKTHQQKKRDKKRDKKRKKKKNVERNVDQRHKQYHSTFKYSSVNNGRPQAILISEIS